MSPELQEKIQRALLETRNNPSVSGLNALKKAYDVVARAHLEVGEAIAALKGDTIATSHDADELRDSFNIAIEHLMEAQKHAHNALKAVMPDMEYHDFHDMSV